MNFVDLLLFLIMLSAVYAGYKAGFIASAIGLVGWLGSLVVAVMLYPATELLVGFLVSKNSLLILGVAFLVTIFLVRLLLAWLINLVIDRIPDSAHRTLTDSILGVIPGFVNGVIYAALFAAIFLVVPVSATLTASTSHSPTAMMLNRLLTSAEKVVAPRFTDRIQQAMGRTTVETGSDDFIRLNFKVTDAPTRPELEARMLEMVNMERAKAGLSPLAADTAMRSVARKHSADMFARGYFSHYTPEHLTPFDRMYAAHLHFLAAGENLAIAPSLVLAHDGLMRSPGHRANILQPAFGRVGIGILDGGIYGLMVAQEFRN